MDIPEKICNFALVIEKYLYTEKMKRVDLYLSKPINLLGEKGTSYPQVNHIDTTSPNNEYVEDVNGEILFLNEMDEIMKLNTINIIKEHTFVETT